MVATYLILNVLFIAAVCLLAWTKPRRPGRAFIVTFTALIVLTAVFDNIIVGLSIVGYDPAKILGIKVGVAPIEDFMYAVLAVLLVPIVWHKLGDAHAK